MQSAPTPLVASVNTAGVPVTPPLRAPFGWPVAGLLPPSDSFAGGSLVLTWPQAADEQCAAARAAGGSRGGWLRISVSVDDRECKIVTVSLARSGAMIGQFDLRYSHSLEPWQIQLNASAFAAALEQGLRLTLTQASTPLWILAPGLPGDARALEPHLLADAHGILDTEKTAAFFRLLGSRATAQTFGWMEGCLLDAFHDLDAREKQENGKTDTRWRAATDAHFSLFITQDSQLVYESPRGNPCDGQIYGIEGTLPFAALAKRHPKHPLIDMLLAYYRGHLNADGSFCVPESYTAEGSYTIAYPLAVVAAQRKDAALATLAANVLRQRRERLRRPEGLWLRHHPDDSRTFRSWARGVAWYMLGLTRTLEQLAPGEHGARLVDTDDLREEFCAAAHWALGLQRATGLWGCYLDGGEEDTMDDSSGSAGIAAALAQGVQLGLFPAKDSELAREAAQRCWAGLLPHLTPDGFLDGVAQSNRGGESLQRAPYRVLSPMAMGLMGQLAAALQIKAC